MVTMTESTQFEMGNIKYVSLDSEIYDKCELCTLLSNQRLSPWNLLLKESIVCRICKGIKSCFIIKGLDAV